MEFVLICDSFYRGSGEHKMLASKETIKNPNSFTQQETTSREWDQKHLGKTTKPTEDAEAEDTQWWI